MSKEDLNELSKAYVKAFAEFPNAVKDATNPHLGNDYATLESVLAAVKPVLSKYDLAIYQAPAGMQMVGDTLVASVVTVLTHGSGQSLNVVTQMPVAPQYDKKSGASRVTAQGVGSAISYARRYALNAICGITQVDDDGSAASEVAPRGASRAAVDSDASLVDAIRATATLTELEEFKAKVMELGDQAVAKAYREQKKELKAKEKGE